MKQLYYWHCYKGLWYYCNDIFVESNSTAETIKQTLLDDWTDNDEPVMYHNVARLYTFSTGDEQEFQLEGPGFVDMTCYPTPTAVPK